MKRKILKLFCVLLTLLIFFSCSMSCFANNKKKDTIIVGLCDVYHAVTLDTNGNYTGYGYDYLNEIAKYNNWDYEFRVCSYEENIKNIEAGEIDIFLPVHTNINNSHDLLLSDLPYGKEYCAIYVNKDNNDICFNDFTKFNGMKVAVIDNSVYKDIFENFCQENNFSVRTFVCKNLPKMQDLLNNGAVDAIVCGSTMQTINTKAVAKFDVDYLYFALSKNNQSTLIKLNNAMKQINTQNMYFDTKLYDKYYKNNSVNFPIFTKEEINYIKLNPTLTFSFDPSWAPFEYIDNKSHSIKGINYDILQNISKKSGIKFNYIKTSSFSESIDNVTANKADAVISYSSIINNNISQYLNLTDSYIDIPFVMVSLNSFDFDNIDSFVIPKKYIVLENYIKSNYPKSTIVKCENISQCINKVKQNDADVAIVDTFSYKSTFQTSLDSSLKAISFTNVTLPISIGLSGTKSEVLVSILNKSIANLTPDDIESVILCNTTHNDNSANILYILKKHMPVITIGVSIFFFTIIVYMARVKNSLVKVAYTDILTKYPNYEKFKHHVSNHIKNKNIHKYYIAYFDIQKFKYINNVYGYETGNKILTFISHFLSETLGENEYFARIYADNFVLILKKNDNTSPHEQLYKIFEEFQDSIYQKFNHIKIYVNCGIYEISQEDTIPNDIIDKANIARQTNKGNHNNFISYYNNKLRDKIFKEKEIEDKMQKALDNNEFVVYYQPKFRISDKSLYGAEALVRWKSDSGFMQPYQFIPLFEKNGFIVKVDMFVLEQVCKKMKYWIDNGYNVVPVSVNLSRLHLDNINLINNLTTIVDRYNIAHHLIEFELTESSAYSNMDNLIKVMNNLHMQGFKISMDDFGSGYSSLNVLRDIPIDVVKLDRAFLTECTNTGKGETIIETIVRMANLLEITVICEGVETVSQANFLKSVGCNLAQGYLYAKPMPSKEFEMYLFNKITI